MNSAERAEQLIALACSTEHEEEARTAALAAARIIRKEGLRVVPAPASPFVFVNHVRGGGKRTGHGGQNVAAERAWYEAAWKMQQEPEPPPPKAPPNGFWRTSYGQPECTCHACGRRIEDGERYYCAWPGEIWCRDH